MSKSIYDEALNIIKQRVNTIRLNTKIGSRRIADEENAVLLDNIEYNLNKLCELVEKQEKLLELYRYLNENTNDYDLHPDEVDAIDKKIEELENEIRTI